jgi:hypothetical protein
MRFTLAASVSALVAATALSALAPVGASAEPDDKEIKLSGCLVSGESGGFLLTNVPGEPVWQRSAEGIVLPDAVGTTGAVATVFYWLDDHSDLKNHVGHLVEVEGELQGKIEDGAIEVDRKSNWTELKLKSGDRELKARVAPVSIIGASTRDDRKVSVLVRQVDVQRVRMLDASCRS